MKPAISSSSVGGGGTGTLPPTALTSLPASDSDLGEPPRSPKARPGAGAQGQARSRRSNPGLVSRWHTEETRPLKSLGKQTDSLKGAGPQPWEGVTQAPRGSSLELWVRSVEGVLSLGSQALTPVFGVTGFGLSQLSGNL